jgi:predicted RNA binding protein YcfA (HicA-like mRNA interferase family)
MGFEQIRQKGSHIILKKATPQGEIGCVVPLHKELAPGTLRGILHQAHIAVDDFVRNM